MWTPDITVAAICERDGKFLLVEERSKSTGDLVLNQPAGHLDDGETVLQAVKRETLEETCCHFTPQAVIGFYRMRTARGKTYLRYALCGTVSEPDPDQERDADILRTHWLSWEELNARDDLRSPLVLSCIRDYRNGIRYPLEILRELDDQ